MTARLIKFFQEVLICVLSGGVLCLLAFLDEGVGGVEGFITSLDTSDQTVIYFFILAAIQFLLSTVWYYSPRYISGIKTALGCILPIINGVSASLLALYRIVAGTLLVITVIMVFNFSTVDKALLSTFALYSFVFVLVSFFINKINNYALTKQQVGLTDNKY